MGKGLMSQNPPSLPILNSFSNRNLVHRNKNWSYLLSPTIHCGVGNNRNYIEQAPQQISRISSYMGKESDGKRHVLIKNQPRWGGQHWAVVLLQSGIGEWRTNFQLVSADPDPTSPQLPTLYSFEKQNWNNIVAYFVFKKQYSVSFILVTNIITISPISLYSSPSANSVSFTALFS